MIQITTVELDNLNSLYKTVINLLFTLRNSAKEMFVFVAYFLFFQYHYCKYIATQDLIEYEIPLACDL